MCLGQCVPFVMAGEDAESFDRDILAEYNQDLGGALHIQDAGDRIVVTFLDDMEEKEKDNAHLILETMGFE